MSSSHRCKKNPKFCSIKKKHICFPKLKLLLMCIFFSPNVWNLQLFFFSFHPDQPAGHGTGHIVTLHCDMFCAVPQQLPKRLLMRYVATAVLPMCWTAGRHVTCSMPCIKCRTMSNPCGASKFLCAVCWLGFQKWSAINTETGVWGRRTWVEKYFGFWAFEG